jgi:hypothetical protein
MLPVHDNRKGGQGMRCPRLSAFGVGPAAGCFVLGATMAAAASPDLRGTWKVEGDSIVGGASPFHPANAPPAAQGMVPRLRHVSMTLRVDGQEGERFWGVSANADATEDFIGSFTGEPGGRFLYVDVDGFMEGTVGADGTMRYCYRHVTPTSRVISCGTATRE